jgi:hypothetical protein
MAFSHVAISRDIAIDEGTLLAVWELEDPSGNAFRMRVAGETMGPKPIDPGAVVGAKDDTTPCAADTK